MCDFLSLGHFLRNSEQAGCIANGLPSFKAYIALGLLPTFLGATVRHVVKDAFPLRM